MNRTRSVSIVGTAQVTVKKKHELGLRELGAQVTKTALASADMDEVDGLYLANMLSDELQSQKHLATLVADEAGLIGVDALQVRAATATGAAALRVAYLAIASGVVNTAVVVGVEKMSDQSPIPALAKALDARYEVPDGVTLVSQNAKLMWLYLERYRVSSEAFVNFSVNAHRNAKNNPHALFQNKIVTAETVLSSRLIVPPIRLYDCAPICDGAAAVVLAPSDDAHRYTNQPIKLLASASTTDRFRVTDRADPLHLSASEFSVQRALKQAGINRQDLDFIEIHDAFSIISCLQLEAMGFAKPGEGWRLAAENQIALNGPVPITTMGGLKARGHPIGATALYQTCEIVTQLTGQAGINQLSNPQIGMLHSVGGVGSTALTHIFGV